MPPINTNPTEVPRKKTIAFSTTRWTRILQAQGESSDAHTALSELCEQYYQPVEAFIRQRRGAGRAADLTQAFFAKFLKSKGFHRVELRRARFRSYLLGAVKHFLSDQNDHEQAAKRGGGVPPIPLDASSETSPGIEVPDNQAINPEQHYDRQWAVTLLNHCLAKLRLEFTNAGKAAQFEILKHWLPGNSSMSQAEAREQLRLSDGAFKVAIHRLRKQFRATVKEEIAQTVESEADLKAELRYLIEVLS